MSAVASERRAGGIRIDVPAVLSFVALAGIILAPRLGSSSALVFLLAGGALALINLSRSVEAMLRYWAVIVPFTGLCLASTLWSLFPFETLRASLQLAATFGIAIIIAARVPAAVLIRTLFWVLVMSVVASILFGRIRDDNGAWVGIFGSKNAFAAVVSTLVLVAVPVLMERGGSLIQKGVALASLVAAAPLLLLAQSAGALGMLAPSLAAVLLVLSGRWLSVRQRLVMAGGLALGAITVVVVSVGYVDAIWSYALGAAGKDVTLTGRTDLWTTATKLIETSPWVGLGYRAFWVPGYGPAEVLWHEFGIAMRAGFNFHNAYLNIAVEIGLIGATMQIALLGAAVFGVAAWSFRQASPAAAFFAGYLTLVVCGSFIEALFFYQFSLQTILVITGLVYALHVMQPVRRESAARSNRARPRYRGSRYRTSSPAT